jgi:cobaltochelatase CobS
MSNVQRLSADARNALRRAITNHASWDNYRKANGLSLATMARDDYFRAARDLGIDIATVAREAEEAPQRDNAKHESAFRAAAQFEHDNQHRAQQAAEAFKDAPSIDDVLEANKRDHAAAEERKAERAKPAPAGNAAEKLMALIAELSSNQIDETQIREIVQREIDAALLHHAPAVRILITDQDGFSREVNGHKHPKFATLLKVATSRDVNGYPPCVWLAGPAGSGKTYAVAQVAKALDLPWHYNGAIGMAHELLGFVDANGVYHRTPFREAYEHGGCYLFDEVDGSDNSALLALNAALANGTATFPDGQVTRHKDCRIFAAANTWGLGGTVEYVGRSKIDAAFLSRFPVRLDWQYDEVLERAICGNEDFASRVQRARQHAKSAGLKVLITPRDSIAGAALIAAGMSSDEAAEITYLANLDPAQKRMVEGS